MRRHDAGFSLLEVLVAVAIVGIVYGFLLQFVASNISDVGEARRAADLSRLAEVRLREIESEATIGKGVPDGGDEGTFEEPDDDVYWRTTTEPWQLPLPADFSGTTAPSPIFSSSKGEQLKPVLQKVDLRVFVEGDDPELATPFVIFLLKPGALEGAGAEQG